MSRKTHIAVLFVLFFFLPLFAKQVLAEEEFELHVLDVGQGQSVMIQADEHYILIDGGGRSTSSYVVSYLKQQGIEALDCIVLSHYEEDHMGGIIGVLSVFPCSVFLAPPYAGTGDLYQSLAVSTLSNGCGILHPEPGFEFSLGDAVFRVIGPQRTDYTTDNDLSLCVTIQYGVVRAIICGDAQHDSETDLVNSDENLKADIYVVNHHGSSTSSMDAFLEQVSPRYAIISCGKDNGYGHPSMETIQRLQNLNITMFRTDLQGEIIAYSDGADIWFNEEPCEDWSAGDGIITFTPPAEETGEVNDISRFHEADPEIDENTEANAEQEQEFQYVCNTNTKKFHKPNCSSVSQMKETNRLYTSLSREELIAEGYKPCGSCKP